MNSYIDQRIISMRKDNAYIKTILAWVIKEQPMIDEIVLLGRVLDILDKNNLAVSRNEVRTAFNQYYKAEFHSEKNSYLAWLYTNFHIKTGTLVNSSNVRSQPTKKEGIPQILTDKNSTNRDFSSESDIRCLKTEESPKTAQHEYIRSDYQSENVGREIYGC